MSGRLVILPKKSYTPWNPQNVERVLKDERLHRERVEKEEEERRKQDNKRRIQLMKERMKSLNNDHFNEEASAGSNTNAKDGYYEKRSKDCSYSYDSSCINETSNNLKHVNLFEEEEKQILQTVTETCAGMEQDKKNSRQQDSVGIMPVFLSACLGRKDGDTSKASTDSHMKQFYERGACLRKDVDDKVKRRYDPMACFHVNENKQTKAKDSASNAIKDSEAKPNNNNELQRTDEKDVQYQHARHRKKKKRKGDSLRSDGRHSKRSSRKNHDFNSSKSSSKMDVLKARKLQREHSEIQREEVLKRA